LFYGCNIELNYWKLCCIHSFELQLIIVNCFGVGICYIPTMWLGL